MFDFFYDVSVSLPFAVWFVVIFLMVLGLYQWFKFLDWFFSRVFLGDRA